MENNIYKDWKFWFKLTIGILPFVGIIVFTTDQLVYALHHMGQLPFYVPSVDESGLPKTDGTLSFDPEYLKEMINWTKGQRIAWVFARNTLALTTIGNVLFGAFFINSAINHRNEGKGKFDNFKFGISIMLIYSWVVYFYNFSLLLSLEFKNWTWRNWFSWIIMHSTMGIAGFTYFIVVYDKKEFDNTKATKLTIYKWTMLSLFSYFFFFSALGMIIKHTGGFKIFGDMSYSGEFIYPFLELDNSLAMPLHDIPAWVKFICTMIFFFAILTGIYIGYYAACNRWSKIQNGTYIPRKDRIKEIKNVKDKKEV